MLTAEETYELPLEQVLSQLPSHDVRVEGGGFDVADEEYAGIVGRCCARRSGGARARTS